MRGHIFSLVVSRIILLTLSPLIFSQSALATSIFAVRNDNEIVIGGDSKGVQHTYEGGDIRETDPRSACKIFRAGDLFVAIAGLSSLSINIAKVQGRPFDARKLIAQVVPLEGTIAKKANAIEKAIVNLFADSAEIIMPITETAKIPPVVAIIVAGMENESPKLVRIVFKAVRLSSGAIDIESKCFECPGDCEANGTSWVSMGFDKAIRKYLDGNRDFLINTDLVEDTRKLIEMEISENPSDVGGPIDILRITKKGHEWVHRKDMCVDYDKAIDANQAADSTHNIQERPPVITKAHDRTFAELNRAVEVNPKSGGAYMDRGFFYQEKKQYDLALADFSKAIELNPMDEFPYRNRAILYESRNQFDLAIADYSRVIALNPRKWKAFYSRGWMYYFIKRDYDKAIADYTSAIELNPQFDGAYLNRGVIYEIRKQFDLAFADFSKAIEMNPQNDGAYNSRGWFYYRVRKDFDTAVVDLSKAIELNSHLAVAYINRGTVFADKKLDDQALVDFNKAIELNPKNERAYSSRGWFYHHKKKDYDKAIIDYTKAIELNPQFDETYISRGTVFANKKLDDQALADFDKAIELNPKNERAYSSRAWFYHHKKKDYDKAIIDYTKAIELNPQFDVTYINRGTAFADKKLGDQALADFNKAIELNPKSFVACYDKARFYAIRNNTEEACLWFKKAVSLGYDHWDHIKQDKDLDNIRTLSSYMEIVADR
jgi:tetratricopeptide (TPR) repeat protein